MHTALIMDITLAVISVITATLISTMLIDFIKHEYKFKEYGLKFWNASSDILISALILIQYDIFAFHTSTNRIYSVLSTFNVTFNPLWCSSSSVELLTLASAKLFLYSFFLLRLHNVFKNSSLSVPKFTLKIVACSVFIPLILNVITGFINAGYRIRFVINPSIALDEYIHNFLECDVLEQYYSTKILNMIKYIGVALYLLAELIYTIVILRLFISRVLLLSMSFEKLKAAMEQKKANRGRWNRTLSQSKTTTTNHLGTDRMMSISRSQSPGSRTPEPMSTSDKEQRSQTYTERMEAKNSEIFLNLAIKTTNLIIMAICSNYLILFKFGLGVNTAILNIDALCNCISVYLSYQFSSKYYDKLFSPCHRICYGCCVRLCFCCCLPTELPQHMQMQEMQRTTNNEKNRESTEHIEDTKNVDNVKEETATPGYDDNRRRRKESNSVLDDNYNECRMSSSDNDDGLNGVDIIIANDDDDEVP